MTRKLVIMTIISAIFFVIPLNGCLFLPDGLPSIGPEREVTGSQDMATWEYEFTDFTNLNVSDAFTVYVSQSDSYSVGITANENLLDYLSIDQKGETLYIGMKSARYYDVSYEANITMPLLLDCKLSGASKGDISGFSSANPLELELSGASSISGSIATGDCNFNLSGASRVELTGSGDDADINASDASKIELADFPINSAEVKLRGASQATLNLDGTLDANLRDYSHIKYIGEPTLGDITTYGSSTVSKQ
ncbi:GIN domain-containing protein [Chloroflexota bacterium]